MATIFQGSIRFSFLVCGDSIATTTTLSESSLEAKTGIDAHDLHRFNSRNVFITQKTTTEKMLTKEYVFNVYSNSHVSKFDQHSFEHGYDDTTDSI
jgi:hypothetical protein